LGYSNRPDQKSLSSVAATGFLPGVLSFLCALSHLERIAHRPTTYSSNLNHLSHLERVLYNWPTSPTQSSTAWPQQPMGKIDTGFPTGSTMADGLTQHKIDSWLSQGQKFHTGVNTGSICSDRGCLIFSEINTDFSCLEGVRGILAEVRTGSRFRRSGRMEEEPPTRLILALLFACTWVDTCHP
jgi:hypothetical protein